MSKHAERLEEAFNNIHDLTRIYSGKLLVLYAEPYAKKAESSLEYLIGYIKGQDEVIKSLIEKIT